MAYTKCFSTQPYSFKLTHDISVENFRVFDDDDDEKLFPHLDFQANVAYSPNTTPTSAYNELFTLNENDNDTRKTKQVRPRNNSQSSTDSLNLRNSTLNDSSVQSVLTETNLGTKTLRIEDVEMIDTELVKDGQKTGGRQERGKGRRGEDVREAHLSPPTERLLTKKNFLSTSAERQLMRDNYLSSTLSNFLESSNPKPDVADTEGHSGVVRRRPRKPRKLPEIPSSASNPQLTAVRPTELPNLARLSSSSLADELQEALLADHPPFKEIKSAGRALGILGRTSTHRHSINLDELGTPDVIDPEHKIKMDASLHSLAGICEDFDAQNDLEPPTNRNSADVLCFFDDDDNSPKDIHTTPQRSYQKLAEDTHANLNLHKLTNSPKRFSTPHNMFYLDDKVMEEKFNSSSVSSPSRTSTLSSRSMNSIRQATKEDRLSDASTRSSSVSSFTHNFDPEELDLEPTHRGCHKFIPRHDDELFIEIGDAIYVDVEADDLWCEGINLRTGKRGSFPAAYATDLDLLEGEIDGTFKFRLNFLGSVEVTHHKGDDVLCQAIHRVVHNRKTSLTPTPPPQIFLEINEYGIKMIDRTKKLRNSSCPDTSYKTPLATRILRLLSKEKEHKTVADNFFSLKNISFCGFHPKNDKYFGFITKHPLETKFACHVFSSEKTTRPIAEAIGDAFRRFYQEYLAFVHPTEDIYME